LLKPPAQREKLPDSQTFNLEPQVADIFVFFAKKCAISLDVFVIITAV